MNNRLNLPQEKSIEYVYHSEKGVCLLLQSEELDADEGLLEDHLESMVDDGWVVDRKEYFESVRHIREADFSTLPDEPKTWLIENGQQCSIIVEATGDASVLEPGTKLKSTKVIDEAINQIPADVRNSIIQRFLIATMRTGELCEKLRGDAHDSLRVNVKVIVCDADADQIWSDNRLFSRVPVIGESVEITGDTYRVLNVLHTNHQCGLFAVIRCVAIESISR